MNITIFSVHHSEHILPTEHNMILCARAFQNGMMLSGVPKTIILLMLAGF